MGKIRDYEKIQKFAGDEVFVVETDEGTKSLSVSSIAEMIVDTVEEKAEMLNQNDITIVTDTQDEYVLNISVGGKNITTPNLRVAVDTALSGTSDNAVANRAVAEEFAKLPFQALEIADGIELFDVPDGSWYLTKDATIKNWNEPDSAIALHCGDIIRKNYDNYTIITTDWTAAGSLFESVADTTLLSLSTLWDNTDDTLNELSINPVRNSVVTKQFEDIKTKLVYPDKYWNVAEPNTEYRYLYPGADKIQLAMPTQQSNGGNRDFICSLVFRSPETATEFIYDKSILFTGDDCEDNVFVPVANKIYNLVYWYDGYCYNAVVRGVTR